MAHWKSMMDREYLGWFDLPPRRDAIVTIERVEAGELVNLGKKSNKPIAFFVGKTKGLALNSTNCKTLERLFGWDTDKWIGKQIALYVGTTQMAGEEVQCIRIRPKLVKGKDDPGPLNNNDNPVREAREPGEDG